MEEETSPTVTDKPSKRKGDKSQWKCNKAKRAKKEERNKGCIIACKHTIDSKICKVRTISITTLYQFHKSFHNISDAIEGRKFLQRYICVSTIKRPRVDEEKRIRPRNLSTGHFIPSSEGLIPVCKEAFLGILSVGRTKVELAAKSMLCLDSEMKETRGGSKKMKTDLRELVVSHISSFRGRERHYGRSASAGRIYLSAELNVRKMFNLFKEQHPDVECKYWFYYNIFRTSFNVGFGSIKKDTCADCLRFTNTLNATEDAQTKNEIMAERLLHKLRAKRFFKELNLCPEDSISINFDLMQNQPLPKTSIGPAYYSRQIWYYTFGIVIHTDKKVLNSSTLYFYR